MEWILNLPVLFLVVVGGGGLNYIIIIKQGNQKKKKNKEFLERGKRQFYIFVGGLSDISV